MKLIHLITLSFIMLLTACRVEKPFQADDVQSYASTVMQSEESDPQVYSFEPEMDSNLCISGEEIIFHFKFEDSNKIFTVANSKELDYLVCRMGTKDAIDLEFPQDKTDSWDQFCYQYYRRGGGFQNLALNFDYLNFETDDFRYKVFRESQAVDEDQYKNSVGLIIIDKESIREKGELDATKIIINGDFNSIVGSFDQLQDTKIKKSFR